MTSVRRPYRMNPCNRVCSLQGPHLASPGVPVEEKNGPRGISVRKLGRHTSYV